MIRDFPRHPGCESACQYAEDLGVGGFHSCSPRCVYLDRREPVQESQVGLTRVYHTRPDRQHPDGPSVDLARARAQVHLGGAYLAQFRGQNLACICGPSHCGGLVLAYLAEDMPVNCLDLFLRNC